MNVKQSMCKLPVKIYISTDFFTGEFGNEILTKLLNDMCNSEYIPSDPLKSLSIALTKRSVAIECTEVFTINIINNAT